MPSLVSKIYPGHGIIFVRGDSKSFRLLNGKCTAHFKAKKNPRKLTGPSSPPSPQEGNHRGVAKRRARKTVKVQRAIVGATWEEIIAKRSEPESVRRLPALLPPRGSQRRRRKWKLPTC